jgi:hypothetical protein
LPRLVLLVDDHAGAYLDDADAFEEAVEAAASVLVAAGRASLPIALWRTSGQRSVDTTAAGLDLLAQVQPVDGVDLVTAMHRLRLESTGDTLVVVTGPHADLRPIMAARTGYARVVVVVLGQAATVSAPPIGATLIAAAAAAEFVDKWNGMLR